VVVIVSQFQCYLSTLRPKYKSIAVVDDNDAMIQIGTQIEALPEVMITTALMAWGKMLLLQRLY
jgi:hypothetical protein